MSSPDDVLTARLVGGDLDGLIVEIDGGTTTLRLGPPLVVFGAGSDEARREFAARTYEYRFAGVEEGDEGRRAIFVLRSAR